MDRCIDYRDRPGRHHRRDHRCDGPLKDEDAWSKGRNEDDTLLRHVQPLR